MLKNINNRWFYLMVGFLLVSFASLNGNKYPTYDMNLVTQEVAIIIYLIGAVIFVVALVCILMDHQFYEKDIKKEKAQLINNQKKWREHYSAFSNSSSLSN